MTLATKGASSLRVLAIGLALCASAIAAAADAQYTDRIIVKYRAPAAGAIARQAQGRAATLAAQRFGLALNYLRTTALGSQVLEVGRELSLVDAERLAADIAASDPNVEYAEPDRIVQHAFTPGDPRYHEQWHYFEATSGINAPAAWDKSTGSGVVVAVLDTGYRPHPDLAGQLLPGYDFISNLFRANDGNGRDSDARDPGDWTNPGECGIPTASTWHGTHVAGTIAARTNNGSGVAGVAFGARIVPVRVVGTCGGFTSDMADGIVWSSGGAVNGVPANANPARVINLSLATRVGVAPCDNTTQNAIDSARSRGAAVIVAAGNENRNAADATPGNCNGVVTVAAVGRNGGKPQYSNVGAVVEVAAPGGNGGFGGANSVLSTHNAGAMVPGADNYQFMEGTSMATPHVAGVVALMLSVQPTLTPDQVTSILQRTARPFPATCSDCGSGMVDAPAAVEAAIRACPNPHDEIAIIQNGVWHGVDLPTVNGTSYPTADWSNPEAMASTYCHIFTVQGGELWKTHGASGSTISLGGGWGGSEAMAAVDGVVYTVWGGTLWRTVGDDGSTAPLESGWTGTEALAAGLLPSGRHVFGVQGGVLWKTDGETGVSTSLGSGWGGTEAMTFGGGFLYAVRGDQLWKVEANLGQSVEIIEGYGWSGTEAMTYRDGFIYAVQGGTLWRTSPNGGSTPLGTGWSGTQVMTAVE